MVGLREFQLQAQRIWTGDPIWEPHQQWSSDISVCNGPAIPVSWRSKIEIPSPQFFDRPCQMPDRGLEDEFPLKFYLSSGSMLKNRGGYIQAPRNAGLFRIYVWVVSSKTPREDHHTCIMQPPRSKAPILTVVLKYHVQTWQWKIHNFWMIYP